MVESLPANAGDTDSSPGLGRSHVPRSSWTREPQLLSDEEWPPLAATRESPRMKRRPNTAKNKYIKKKILPSTLKKIDLTS